MKKGQATVQIKITRAVLLGGEVAEEGSVHNVERSDADYLVAIGSAVHLNWFSRFLQGLWFFRDRRTSRATVPTVPATEVHEEKKMNRAERVAEVLEQADKLGLHPRLVRGVLAVNGKGTGDPEKEGAIRAEMVKYLPDVRQLVERRELAAHAKALIGKRILLRQSLIQSVEVVEGVFADANIDGAVTISLESGGRSPNTVTANPAALLLVLDEEAGAASSPRNDEQKSRHAPLGGG